MAEEIKVGDYSVYLFREGSNVRVKVENSDVIFINQDVNTLIELISKNFDIVVNHYILMTKDSEKEFELKDINFISMSVVLHFLYMYNSWRTMYKKQENRSLLFLEKDFKDSSTHDIIFNYYKSKHSTDWEEKCAILLGLKLEELKEYYKLREQFYNK